MEIALGRVSHAPWKIRLESTAACVDRLAVEVSWRGRGAVRPVTGKVVVPGWRSVYVTLQRPAAEVVPFHPPGVQRVLGFHLYRGGARWDLLGARDGWRASTGWRHGQVEWGTHEHAEAA